MKKSGKLHEPNFIGTVQEIIQRIMNSLTFGQENQLEKQTIHNHIWQKLHFNVNGDV